jgi:hypothetical protein
MTKISTKSNDDAASVEKIMQLAQTKKRVSMRMITRRGYNMQTKN